MIPPLPRTPRTLASAIAATLACLPAGARAEGPETESAIPTPAPAAIQAAETTQSGAPVAAGADLADLRRELDELRARLDANEATGAASPATSAPAKSGGEYVLGAGLRLGGYVQGQYESHQDSEDELAPGGKLLNEDRFLVRRARLKLSGDWQYAAAIFEINGTTAGGGFGLNIRRAEASLHYRPEGREKPLVAAAIGAMDIPFGYELLQSSRERLFMERALVVRSLFPSPTDVGARIGGTLDWFHWTLAAMNGEPQGEKVGFPGAAPKAAKDYLLRVGVDTRPSQRLRIGGDVSLLQGRGFHAGTPATKARIDWRDLNEDGVVQSFELTPIPGASATPSSTFERWAVGADLQVELRTELGATELAGELIYGENMDRLLFSNDPVVTGLDAREFGYYVSLVQELGRYAVVGLRYDAYEPDSNRFDKRRGQLVPTSSRIETWSPVVGLVLPDRARLTFQYDFVRDELARDSRGVPTDLANDAWTLRLQVQM